MDFNILREAGVPSLFVVGVVVAVSLMKLFHATRAYARQGRKECLELWDGARVGDSFWLESYFRHLYNVKSPPADLIREGLQAFNPAYVCLELSMNWRFFKGMNLCDLQWRSRWLNRAWFRRSVQVILLILYGLPVSAAVYLWERQGSGIEVKLTAVLLVVIGASSFWRFLEMVGAARALETLRQSSPNSPNLDANKAVGTTEKQQKLVGKMKRKYAAKGGVDDA